MEAKRERYTPHDVGPSPLEWKTPYLKEVSTLITNGFVGTATPYYTDDSGIPYLYGTNVRANKIDSKGMRYISHDFHEKQAKTALKVGDLLTVQSGHIGETAAVTEEFDNANCHALIVTRLKKDLVYPQFLSYYINSEIGRARLKGLEVGSTILHINTKDLKRFRVLLPSLPEQQKIAKILSTWDKAISTTERLIDNSIQQKKALMQQLLTGKQRLLDESGERFEGEWEEVKLSAVAQITMGSSPKSEAYNEVGDGLPLLQGNADIKNRKSVPRIYTSQITKECHADDILFSVRAPVGTVAISNHHACIGRGIAAIKAKKNHSQDYIYQWLLSFETKWERYSQGSTFEAVNSNDIKSLNLSVPNFKEQQKIATVLTNADKEIELLEQQLADLQQEKKALMQVLLTGKKRVVVDGEI